MKAFKIHLLLILCCFCLSGRAENPIIKSISEAIWGVDPDENPAPEILSSNWINSAKAALPTNYPGTELSFRDLTNLTYQESQKGNNAAQGLWGFLLVVKSHSEQDTSTGLQLLRNSAEKGYVPAMVSLGFLLEGNRYLARNYEEAFHWFSLAAENHDAEGQLQLGGCYHYGLGTKQNDVMAATYYHFSADQGNYVAMKSLGYLLMNGRGGDKDVEEARYWFTRAAKEGGNRRAMYDLGVLCARKFPDTNSMKEAFNWYSQSADKGDALACFALAQFYCTGWGGVETNLDKYHYWRARAATLGATQAQYLMADAYERGDGVPKDSKLAKQWYEKAAAKFHPTALYNLATYCLKETNEVSLKMANDYLTLAAQRGHREAQFQCALNYIRGNLVPIDFEKGKHWLQKSAENGWGRAEFLLFQLYYNGAQPGSQWPQYPQDRDEGIKWLQRAAGHGNLQAQAVLGVMLIKGENIEQNKTEAEKLLRNAAEHGYPRAQNDLGFAILNGDTSKRDIVESAMWCQLGEAGASDSQFQQRAKVNLSNAMSQLSTEEQAEVARRVKEFHPVPVVAIDPMLPGWETNADYQQEDGKFGH